MNYANIKNCDIANGPGVRVSLFVSRLPASLQRMFQCGDVGFQIRSAVYKSDGSGNFRASETGLYPGIYVAWRRAV